MSFLSEINRRRTFGIISHPDAGKTTLTEKLLLFGGAINEAGAVKSNKIKKGATSDFMEIERQRGISVTTSVLAFEYNGIKINILDTPGHKDFAEDTFRTLTAVDSVIVVIDVAKGVEEQTEKLVEVCRMRNIPIIVFINKSVASFLFAPTSLSIVFINLLISKIIFYPIFNPCLSISSLICFLDAWF